MADKGKTKKDCLKKVGGSQLNDLLMERLMEEPNYVSDDGKVKKWVVAEEARNYSPTLITLLLKDEKLRGTFFTEVAEATVFKMESFLHFIEQKNYLSDSYTRYSQKIGLQIGGRFMNQRNEVELVFPFKDCILEGGQTKDDPKRKEIFFNQTLAQDEITQLLEPKVLTNAVRYDADGEHPVETVLPEDNLIIRGNNLLALHSIKKRFYHRVKLIYLDPPFNTGNDSFQYNDSFIHSTWLTFMQNRLEIARDLLADDGMIFIHLDDIESSYLKVLCDGVFERKNFINIIAVKSSTPSGTKTAHKDKTIIKQKDFIIVYKKGGELTLTPQYTKRKTWDKHYNLILNNDFGVYSFTKLKDALIDNGIMTSDQNIEDIYIDNPKFKKFYLSHQDEICRLQSHKNKEAEKASRALPNQVYEDKVDGVIKGLYYNGQVITPLRQGVKTVYYNQQFNEDLGMLLCDFWDDIDFQNTQNEGGVSFPTAKKPELLLYRIISLCTKPGDIVLDFFLGSGTTTAVAHKMGRQYIGIDQMDYIKSTTYERMVNVVKGEQSGASKGLNWRGGGSFVYLELKRYNQQFIDEIEKAKKTNELLKVWEQMKARAFFRFNVDMQKIEDDIDGFKTLSIEEQKQALCSLLDMNQLYVNYSDMDDTESGVTEEEKRITKAFYGEE